MESVRIFRIEKHVEILKLKSAATGQSVMYVMLKMENFLGVSTNATPAKRVREGIV